MLGLPFVLRLSLLGLHHCLNANFTIVDGSCFASGGEKTQPLLLVKLMG